MTLTEAVDYIEKVYPQETVQLNDYSFELNSIARISGPKFLYRGERSSSWLECKSTSSRNKTLEHPNIDEITHWIFGAANGYNQNRYSLYFFLRSLQWGISNVEDQTDNIQLDASIAAALQHYGFDTAFIDLTSDINVAAFFAAHKGKVGETGQLLVIPTENIENRFFDLTKHFGDRPKRQKSFVLMAAPSDDLKSLRFLQATKSKWISFTLSMDDKDRYTTNDLLEVEGDKLADDIVDWYQSHINSNNSISESVRKYIDARVRNLIH